MDYLQDLEQIININSYTKNKVGIDLVAKHMTSWLTQLGFELKTYQRELLGDHCLYQTPRNKNLPHILLLGHNDTVFPPDTFEGFSEDEDWIYGPGVCDMKGGNIVALESLRNIYKKNGNITNIDFLLVSDEETGSDDSKLVTAKLAKSYDYCFVFEAAGEKLEVVTGRKGVGTFTIDIEGKAAHAGTSYLKGINANLEASYKLQKLVELTNLDIGTTVNVGKIEGGIGANTISPKASMLLEIRYTQNSEKKRLLDALETITNTSYVQGTTSKLSGAIQRNVMEENEGQIKLIKTIEGLIHQKVLREKRGGVSDANVVAGEGVVTIDGFGPFGDGDHTVKERALKSSFVQRIDMMTKILENFQKN